MRETDEHTTPSTSEIHCLEVLISRDLIQKNRSLQWTLSVYSLENEPVRKNLAFQNSEIFHFMVFDWKRTIKKLLDDHQVSYSIIQYFNPGSLYSDYLNNRGDAVAQELDYLAAAGRFQDLKDAGLTSNFSASEGAKAGGLVFEESEH